MLFGLQAETSVRLAMLWAVVDRMAVGQLGHADNPFEDCFCPTPVMALVDAGERVKQVASGQSHVVVLTGEPLMSVRVSWRLSGITESGKVFTWGMNRHGQCGRDPATG